MTRARTPWLLGLTLGLLAPAACSSSPDGGDGGAGSAGSAGSAGQGTSPPGDNPFVSMLPARDARPSTTTFDVTWKPTTTQLDTAEALGSLEAVPPADGVYRFRAPLPAGADAIGVGKHLLIPGVGLFLVTDLASDAQGGLAVTTEPGSLLEASERGDVELDLDLARDGGSGGLGFSGFVPSQLVPPGWQSQTPGPTSYEFTSGSYKLKYSIAPAGEDYVVNFEGGRDPDAGGGTAKFTSTATLRNLRAQASVHWSGGALTGPGSVSVRTSLAGRATASVTALTGGTKMKVPAKYAIPFELGPIPMFIMLQPSIELSATIQRQGDSTSGSVDYHWDGAVGLNLSPSAPPQPAANNLAGASDGGGQATTQPGSSQKYTFGVSALAEMRTDLGVGILLPPTPSYFNPSTGQLIPAETPDAPARASIYAKFKAETVMNYTVSTTATPPTTCLTAGANAGIYVGGEIKLFSLPVLQAETQTWGTTRSKADPPGCAN